MGYIGAAILALWASLSVLCAQSNTVVRTNSVVTIRTSAKPTAKKPFKISEAEITSVHEKADILLASITALRAMKIDDMLLCDVEIFHRAAAMQLRFSNEEFFDARFVTDSLKVLDVGIARANELLNGRASWTNRIGMVVRGYRSRVDGSVQPYGLAIPASYAGALTRLDVILHGRGATLSEVNFIVGRENTNAAPTNVGYIRLEVYGRWNNAYRFAGETDVFEAMASVMKRYAINEREVVLRGFSMGGAGAWHLGLHFPDRWAALEAGAGFTETIRFAKVTNFTQAELTVLPMLDTEPVALNCFNLPTVAYGGEDDKQLQSSLNIRDQLEREGFHFTPDGLNFTTTELPFIFLIGPKTGHKWHPDCRIASDAFIDEALSKPREEPDRIRFVTYTTKYNKCHWVRIDALEKHYERAEFDAVKKDAGKRVDITISNTAFFTLIMPPPAVVSINGAELRVPVKLPAGVTNASFVKSPKGWAFSASPLVSTNGALRKIHGLAGPIDDAFMEPFICVRPTGKASDPEVEKKALAMLERFVFMYGKWMRGDVRIKNDTEVTADDIARYNIVVFGDRTDNSVLARVLGKLPVRWTNDEIVIGTNRFPAAGHMPVMIYPNPLNPKKYIVINTGHTISEKDWRGSNALQFAHLGDWAVYRLEAEVTNDTVAASGYFGEDWGAPK